MRGPKSFRRPYLAWVRDRLTSRRCRLRIAYPFGLFGRCGFWLVDGFRGWGGVRGGGGPVGGLGAGSGRAGCGGRGAWWRPERSMRAGRAGLSARPSIGCTSVPFSEKGVMYLCWPLVPLGSLCGQGGDERRTIGTRTSDSYLRHRI